MSYFNKTRLAIFDIDGTVFRSSLLMRLVDQLIYRKIFSKKVHDEEMKIRSAWFSRETPYKTYSNAIVDILKENIVGKKQENIISCSKELIEMQKSIYFRYTRDLIKKLRSKYKLVAISGSLQETLEQLNKYINFDYIFGTQFEVDHKGKYTGVVLAEPVKHKELFLKQFVKDNNLTLKGSLAVGDTDSDIGVMELVDQVIVFNPNDKLYEYAKRHKWQVIVERKNVIYKIH